MTPYPVDFKYHNCQPKAYSCRVCHRFIRAVSHSYSEAAGLCANCYQVAMLESEVLGSNYHEQQEDEVLQEIYQINAQTVKEGGDASRLQLDPDSIEEA